MMSGVRLSRPTRCVVAVMFLTAVIAACGNDTSGPLELQGHGGMTADPVARGVWFRTSGCLSTESEPADVMITGITTSPTSDHVSTRVTWNDGSPVVIAKHGQPPVAYKPVTQTTHTGGTLDGCSLDVAVVLSPDTAPVVVRDVTVDYEVDGKAYSARTTLDVTLCPARTRASVSGGCSEPASP
ncbi:hypothetical protein ASC77_06565 [Nocardioides sp. Root1257]|uniref:hypothetical protein n=1 Tax=unclassified Nocardioides TaxID=2615069 RepID=UPI0007002D7D|nr:MULTISPECIES: hypothetical protein [unclassified Nocardioides]KQW48419.1 hypothetical protein ASC77_06565 [Nocardioides sp. Root1257]KRC47593.1 hypothetical protein ASE24_06565 [Nocardioides sp. Root224]